MKRASMNVKPENRTNSNIPADQSLFNCVEEEIINIKHLDEDTEIYNDDEGIPVGVKQENPTKSAEIEDFESSTCDYWYQCHLCFEKKMDFISLVDHIKSTHTTEITIKSIKYPYLEPDIHDSDNYCRSCEKTYVSRALYRTHLRQSHRMYLKPLQAVPTANVPGSINSSFYCSSCERTYTDRRRYRIHMRSTHRIEPIPLPPKQNPDIIPDWNNPDSYCSSCDTTYKSKRSFRKHCRILHNLKSPSKNPSNESPDPLDPNFYCKPCNTTYKSRRSLREHCRKVHGIRFEKPFANPDILPNVSDPNNFCITCNKTLKNNFRFLQHLRIVHKMMDLPQSSDNNEIDINDPNFYCSACEKTLSTKYIFQKHLMSIHFIQIPPAEKKRTEAVVPDADDPNNYCRACEKKYKSKSVYRTHLRYSHKMVLEASVRPTRYVPNCFPDPLDRSLHCPVCNITNKSFSSYRQHCKLVHRVKLEPYNRSIVNPDAIIDIQNPDFYCAQCDKRLATKQRFARHLKCVHKLVYPPTIKKLGTRRNKAL